MRLVAVSNHKLERLDAERPHPGWLVSEHLRKRDLRSLLGEERLDRAEAAVRKNPEVGDGRIVIPGAQERCGTCGGISSDVAATASPGLLHAAIRVRVRASEDGSRATAVPGETIAARPDPAEVATTLRLPSPAYSRRYVAFHTSFRRGRVSVLQSPRTVCRPRVFFDELVTEYPHPRGSLRCPRRHCLRRRGLRGGGNGGGGDYAFAASRDYVEQSEAKEVITNRDELDYVAEDAGEGAFAITTETNRATVLFERTENDARRTEEAYRLFLEAFASEIDDLLSRDGNVVVLWDKTPTDEERELLEDCLRS